MKFFLLLCLSLAFAKTEKYDKIAAVVDGEIILQSEIMAALYQTQNMPGFVGLAFPQLEKKVLDQLVDNKVLLARAKLDTIFVTDEELEQFAEQHLTSLQASQNMDRESMAKAIKAQMGIGIEDFKKKLKSQRKEQGILQKVKGKYVGLVSPTPKEVQAFYKEYQDSLPKQYDCLKLSHIQLKIRPSQVAMDSARDQSLEILKKLDLGSTFESLVSEYSQDESSKFNGGDLGYFYKGSLEPEFERAAFRLDQGMYSAYPVKTKKGYHIIKLLSRKDNEIRTAHILIRTEPNLADSNRTLTLAKKLYDGKTKQTFTDMAKIYSNDKKSNTKGGNLGWFTQSSLDPKYLKTVETLQEGDISKPVLIGDSYHIFKVEKRLSERQISLEEDWLQIESFSQSHLSNEKLKGYLAEWRKQTYIEIR
jgi:peptidyl-prolyl cis-trans isomerase SurA